MRMVNEDIRDVADFCKYAMLSGVVHLCGRDTKLLWIGDCLISWIPISLIA